MTVLTFTPRTTAEAIRMTEKLDHSPFHGEWNIRTGRFEFLEEEECVDELERCLTETITNDIYGYYETEDM